MFQWSGALFDRRQAHVWPPGGSWVVSLSRRQGCLIALVMLLRHPTPLRWALLLDGSIDALDTGDVSQPDGTPSRDLLSRTFVLLFAIYSVVASCHLPLLRRTDLPMWRALHTDLPGRVSV